MKKSEVKMGVAIVIMERLIRNVEEGKLITPDLIKELASIAVEVCEECGMRPTEIVGKTTRYFAVAEWEKE